MPDGKASFGKKNSKTHAICRRCGRHAMHMTTKVCAACGFGKSSRIRRFNWQSKVGIVNKVRKL